MMQYTHTSRTLVELFEVCNSSVDTHYASNCKESEDRPRCDDDCSFALDAMETQRNYTGMHSSSLTVCNRCMNKTSTASLKCVHACRIKYRKYRAVLLIDGLDYAMFL